MSKPLCKVTFIICLRLQKLVEGSPHLPKQMALSIIKRLFNKGGAGVVISEYIIFYYILWLYLTMKKHNGKSLNNVFSGKSVVGNWLWGCKECQVSCLSIPDNSTISRLLQINLVHTFFLFLLNFCQQKFSHL